MSLVISHVLALPATLEANTVYLVSASASELQIVVTGKTNADVRKTRIATDIASDINTALAALRLGDSAGLTADVQTKISTAIAAIGLASSTTLASDVAAKIQSEIAKLDLSNSALFAANIAARDALVLSKNSFAMVADATGDTTVKLGSAMYFYNTADSSWTKVAEYESMDIQIPNKDILAKLSIINGNLAYDGLVIGTVQAGATEW